MSEVNQNGTMPGDDDLLDLLIEDDFNTTVPISETIKDSDDLIDILDEEYDKTFSNTEHLQFTTDYNDSALQSIEFDDNFGDNLEDFSEYDIEEDDADEDLELIQGLRNSLQIRGYVDVELYDYPQLSELANQEAIMMQSNYLDEQLRVLNVNFTLLKEEVMSNRATYTQSSSRQRENEDKTLSDFELPTGFLYIVNDAINNCINSVEDHNKLKEIVTPNQIYNRLNRVLPEEYKIYLENHNLYLYLQSAIPHYIECRNADYYYMRDVELQREKTTSFLLRNEQKLVTHLITHNCKNIKQLFHAGKDILFHCSCCNKKVKLQSEVVSYIVFASEKNNYKTFSIPHLIECPECKQGYVLPMYLYDAIDENLNACYSKGSDKLFSFLTKIATGTALTKINPPFDVMFDNIDVIADIPIEMTENKETIIANSSFVQASNLEYQKAIELFYKHLYLYDSEDIVSNETAATLDENIDITSFSFEKASSLHPDSGKLSVRELAICMSSELSRNYKELKNKALFSLVMKLDDFTFSRETLNRSEYWQNEADLKLYSKVSNVTLNDQDFISLLKYTLGSAYKVGMTIEELKVLVQQRQEYLIKRNNELDEKYNNLLSQIERSLDLLAYTKILNIRQIGSQLLFSYINNTDILNMFDYVTDKMIVNNLAEEYFNVLFCKSKLNNKNDLRTAVATNINTQDIIRKLDKALDAKSFTCSNFAIYESRISAMTANHLIHLRDAADALKHFAYYRFIESLNELTLCNSLCSPEEDKRLEYVKTLASNHTDILQKRYIEFYLKEFTQKDILDLDPTYRSKLYNIEFGQFVPLRNEGESLKDYIERYENLRESDALSEVPCTDYSVMFNDFNEFYITIMAGFGVLSLEDNNFILSNFMRNLLQMCLCEHNRTASLEFLGYTDAFMRRIIATENYTFKTSNIDNIATIYQVLHGNYITLCNEYIIKFRQNFETEVLTERADINNIKFNIIDELVEGLYAMSDTDLLYLSNLHKQARSGDAEVSNESTASIDTDTIENLSSIREDMIIELEFYANRILRTVGV